MTHILILFLVGIIDGLPSYARAFSLNFFLKRTVLKCGWMRVLGCLVFSKVLLVLNN